MQGAHCGAVSFAACCSEREGEGALGEGRLPLVLQAALLVLAALLLRHVDAH